MRQTLADDSALDPTERKFIKMFRHHLSGWKRKIDRDFAKPSYDMELAKLATDPVYAKFALDCPEYVLVRLMGRMSISVGRRLGEIYDKLPRFVASARFDVSQEKVAEKFNGLELDIGLRYDYLSIADREHVTATLASYGADGSETGVAIEIRYNFNPNDSARLRKDVDMAEYVRKAGLFPLYLIYSAISPRDEAIARLTRAGWYFLQGEDASDFSIQLLGIDFLGILERADVRERVQKEVRELMASIFSSYAFSQVDIGVGPK